MIFLIIHNTELHTSIGTYSWYRYICLNFIQAQIKLLLYGFNYQKTIEGNISFSRIVSKNEQLVSIESFLAF